MRFLIYGDKGIGSGGWCYAESLRELGHDVLSVTDPDTADHRPSLFSRAYRKMMGYLPEYLRCAHVEELLAQAKVFQPDTIIVLKGLHLSRIDVEKLKSCGAWVCNVNHDDFFSLNSNNWSRLQREAIPAYDFIFTTRRVNVNEVLPLNKNIEFFPFAYYPRIHRPVSLCETEKNEWGSDVVFVGTYESARAALMEELVTRLKIPLVIHGSQWDKLSRRSALRNCVRSTGVRMDDLCKAIGGAKISLGFLRKENRDEYTQRSFEIPACNGVFLAERTSEHLRLFKEGFEAEFFDHSTPEELCLKVDALLSKPSHLEALRSAGHQAVVGGKHTYVDRLQRLIDVQSEFQSKNC
jgi:spore maturation protein CgeB